MKQKNIKDKIEPIVTTTAANTNVVKTDITVIKEDNKNSKTATKDLFRKKLHSARKPNIALEVCPKNINEYRHLFHNNVRFVNADLEWTLDLRDYPTKRVQTAKNSKQVPPKFYDEDLKKYKAKKKDKSINSFWNWSKYEHLTRNCFGETINQTQFQFSSTLRSFHPMKDVYVNQNMWNELPYKQRNDNVTFLPPFTDKEKNTLNNIDKYTMRPYTTTYDKVLIGKDVIRRKKLIPNKTVTLGEYGEHLALRPYNSNYQDKNIMVGENVYSKHTNTLCLFEMGMRMYGKKNEEKPIVKSNKKKKEQISLLNDVDSKSNNNKLNEN